VITTEKGKKERTNTTLVSTSSAGKVEGRKITAGVLRLTGTGEGCEQGGKRRKRRGSCWVRWS